MNSGRLYTQENYFDRQIAALSGTRGVISTYFCLITIVSALFEKVPGLVSYSRSGHDKAEGEGRYHQILCSSTGTRLYVFTVHDCLIPFQPIPLDLLIPVSFTDPPVQRNAGLLRTLRNTPHDGNSLSTNGSVDSSDSRSVYPMTLDHIGRMGGSVVLYAESAQSRANWKAKIEEALGTKESNKVFEIERLSSDTFMVQNLLGGPASPPARWNGETPLTGKVTCLVPFSKLLEFIIVVLLMVPFQLQQMGGGLLPLGVPRVSGQGLGMILNVSVSQVVIHLDFGLSDAACASSEACNAVCYIGGVWYFPGVGG